MSFKLILPLFLLTHTIEAYEDNDLDGVDDTVDLCPDTSFEKLVDEYGCPEDENYLGILTLQIGNDTSFDKSDERVNDYNFFTHWQYRKWNLSLSNSKQTTLDSDNSSTTSTDDIYLNLGYLFDEVENLQTKASFGTSEDEQFASLDFTYFINRKQTLFSQLSYNKSLGYSMGSGYMINANWYSSLSYDYATSIYANTEEYKALSLFNSYSFLDDFFVIFNYTRALDELSYDHTISLKLGVTFD